MFFSRRSKKAEKAKGRLIRPNYLLYNFKAKHTREIFFKIIILL
jgi:hypothetical protein